MTRDVLVEVVEAVADATGRDFSRYKRDVLHEVVQRELAATSAEAYVRSLRGQPETAHALAERLLVTVTSFFRDGDLWRGLAGLFERTLRDRSEPLRIWCVGCASGEEAYSLAIVAAEAIERVRPAARVQIIASDIHHGALQRARAGVYPALLGVDPDRVRRFFEPVTGGMRIARHVRDLVTFTDHDVTRDVPFAGCDLVVCRNVLIYFERELRAGVLDRFDHVLKPGGFLVLGHDELVVDPRFVRLRTIASTYRRIQESMPIASELEVAQHALRVVQDELAACKRELASTAMELALVTEENRLRARSWSETSELLMRDAELAVLVVGVDRKILYATPAARELADLPELVDLFDTCRDGVAECSLRVRGCRYWLRARRTIAGAIVVVTDITGLEVGNG